MINFNFKKSNKVAEEIIEQDVTPELELDTGVSDFCEALTQDNYLYEVPENTVLNVCGNSAFAHLKDQNVGMLDSCVTISMQILETSISVVHILNDSREINGQVQSIAAATDEMVATVEQINDLSVEALDKTRSVNEDMAVSAEKTEQSKEQIDTVSAVIEQTVDQANKLQDASNEIGNIVKVIQDIAEKTNLLALNATIEAARG